MKDKKLIMIFIILITLGISSYSDDKVYYKNGQLKFSLPDDLNGEAFGYYPDGTPMIRAHYEYGHLLKGTYYYKNGNERLSFMWNKHYYDIGNTSIDFKETNFYHYTSPDGEIAIVKKGDKVEDITKGGSFFYRDSLGNPKGIDIKGRYEYLPSSQLFDVNESIISKKENEVTKAYYSNGNIQRVTKNNYYNQNAGNSEKVYNLNGVLKGDYVSRYWESPSWSTTSSRKKNYYTLYHDNGRVWYKGWISQYANLNEYIYNPVSILYDYEIYYDNGQLYEKGWVDESGEYIGTVSRYYDNGQLGSSITYESIDYDSYIKGSTGDKPVTITPYYKNGRVREVINLLYGLSSDSYPRKYYREGVHEKYYDNGQLESKFYYHRGKRVGKEEVEYSYFKDGSVKTKTPFDNEGRIDGVMYRYWENGTLGTSKSYSKGELDGISKGYKENGSPAYVSEYSKGRYVGERTFYYDSGKVALKSYYSDIDGEEDTTMYYPDGGIYQKAVIEITKRRESFKITLYYPSGEIFLVEDSVRKVDGGGFNSSYKKYEETYYYKDGKLMKKTVLDPKKNMRAISYYDQLGNLVWEEELYQSNFYSVYKEYYQNTHLADSGGFFYLLAKGLKTPAPERTQERYYPNGRVHKILDRDYIDSHYRSNDSGRKEFDGYNVRNLPISKRYFDYSGREIKRNPSPAQSIFDSFLSKDFQGDNIPSKRLSVLEFTPDSLSDQLRYLDPGEIRYYLIYPGPGAASHYTGG